MAQKRGFGTTIDKFQALRHHSGTCNRVEHCKVFNYAVVARLDKGEYVVKKLNGWLKSKVADEAIYSCLQTLGGYGYMEEHPSTLLRDSRLGPIEGTLRY
jgi:alkylation response protein AidB-like acyl-CoA dehydrogenase